MMFLDLVHFLVAMDKILKPVIVSVIYLHQNPLNSTFYHGISHP